MHILLRYAPFLSALRLYAASAQSPSPRLQASIYEHGHAESPRAPTQATMPRLLPPRFQ